MYFIETDENSDKKMRSLGAQVKINTDNIAELQKQIPIPGPKGDPGVGIKSVLIVEVTY